jgi:hypothetical protein
VRDDSIENLIVDAGKQTTIDFAIEREHDQPTIASGRNPLGAAGQPPSNQHHKLSLIAARVRDRWRIGFPNTNRYGDKGSTRPRHSIQAGPLV